MEEKNTLRVTLAQVDLAWENPDLNRQNLGDLIIELSGKTDLIIFPETFTTGFSMRTGNLAESMDGPTLQWLLHLSHSAKVALCGSLLIKDHDLYFNRCLFITPSGEISYYDKRHLFPIGGESDLLTAGGHRRIVHYLGWRIALYICYDIRFPVWCRNVSDTDLMIFTANWPDSRGDVWSVLLRARAIENQVYVAGVNRLGTDGEGISYSGDSQMINSRGEVMEYSVLSNDGLPTYEISKPLLIDFRKKFPVSGDADRFLIS